MAKPPTLPPPSPPGEPPVPGPLRPSTGGPDDDDGLDPRQLAVDAIRKLRTRARTDFAEFKVQYQRLDGLVLVLALAIVIGAGMWHRRLVRPPLTRFEAEGLSFARSAAWLAPEEIIAVPPRLVASTASLSAPRTPSRRHLLFTSTLDPDVRLEVRIEPRPPWSNLLTGLELDRRTRWGELYAGGPVRVRSVAGRDWLRSPFTFAFAPLKGDAPKIGHGLEYAAQDNEHQYVVTFYGTPDQLRELEQRIAPTLRLAGNTALPLLPMTRRLSTSTTPPDVGLAFHSTVMVVAADIVDGRLVAQAGGAGAVVGTDGSVLTNFHVLHAHEGRLHDVFILGRYVAPDRPPELVCAGVPSRSKLDPDADLALIKCDLDLDGKAWSPSSVGAWATLPTETQVEAGQAVWVLGYPDVGGGSLTIDQGVIDGFTGEDSAVGTDYIKTDASINSGNTGGPVVNAAGKLVGIAAAFRTRANAAGVLIETSKGGLVRPLGPASTMLAIAQAGWTPREGHTSVDLAPTSVEAPAEGVRISTQILDAANGEPVVGALLMVFRPDVDAARIDMNRLDEQVVAWGRSNARGEVFLKQRVPRAGTYSVMVVAGGYRALIGDSELAIDDKTPPDFDPWTEIRIEPE